MVNPTCAVPVCRSTAMLGSDGRYMSVDRGPIAVSAASSAVRANVLGRSMRLLSWPARGRNERSSSSIERCWLIRLGFCTVAMQIAPVRIEPGLGAPEVGADFFDQSPEARRVVQLNQMRGLVRSEIFEHEGRRENEPPGIGEDPSRRARAPTAGLVADGHAGKPGSERLRGGAGPGGQMAPGLRPGGGGGGAP